VTVERDPMRLEAARERLSEFDNVELHGGDWHDVLPSRGPFDFVFFDAGLIHESPEIVDLLLPGGLLLKDDMTPDWPGPDPVRDFLFGHPELVAIEILTTPVTAAIVAAKARNAAARRGAAPRGPAPS
jgi:predicted O-methyltransferase YrrM